MPIMLDVLSNRFAALAAELAASADAVVGSAATVIETEAVANCPVDTGAMRASIRKEQTGEGAYEVSVQKDEAAAGEKTYALFVEFGTVHMAAEPFLVPACQSGAAALEAATFAGLV